MPRTPRAVMQTLVAVMLLAGFALLQSQFAGPATPRSDQAEGGAAVSPLRADVPAKPPGVAPDAFDFYVLALSWSPTHCASAKGRGRDDDMQCRSGRPYGFVLHGLWPQHERGWPEFCPIDGPRSVRGPALDAALALTPSVRLVQHQWKKHGTCSGLTPEGYFSAAARAIAGLTVPVALKSPERPLTKTADEVRAAFLDANPGLERASLVVTCRRNVLGEVRVCLDKRLRPRRCSAEVTADHCGGRQLRLLNVRGYWPRD